MNTEPSAGTERATVATGNAWGHSASRMIQLELDRERAKSMTYTSYEFAESERRRLAFEGSIRELTAEEVTRLRQAHYAVSIYLDYVFGPEPEVVYTKPRPLPVSRERKRQLGSAGRLGRLIHRR